MSFSSIPTRLNGPSIMAEWFNALRTAGIAVESFLGTVTGLTTFTIVNNQVAAANVTGLLFDGTTVKMAVVDYRIRRRTSGGGADERVQGGSFVALYKPTAATWSITPGPQSGDDAGVTFSITNAGQVQYVSDNQSGTADESILKYTVRALA
jgi:hypothetical protein